MCKAARPISTKSNGINGVCGRLRVYAGIFCTDNVVGGASRVSFIFPFCFESKEMPAMSHS
jgi:hypothetical protein